MIARILAFAALFPLSALAQLQIFQFDGTNYTAAGPVVNIGAASPGDTIVTRFRVRNQSQGPVVLQSLSLSGEAFTIQSAPSLPYTLSPYAGPASEAGIDIAFNPTFTAVYSATLLLNNVSIVLQGTAAASASLSLAGSTTPLAAGAVVDFGSVAVGSKQTQGFVLSNSSNQSVKVSTVSVAGEAFALSPLATPIQLGPSQSVPFQVTFTPESGTPATGTLTVDGRSFQLAGQGLSAPLPSATIVFASTLGASGQQNSISIPLASASQVGGNGTLTMTFQSSVAGVTDDPAIEFLSGPLRQATVSVSPGDTAATIGGQPGIAFQTGTTAGTITFTLTMGAGAPQQATLTIPAATIVLDSFTAVRQLGALNVAFTGFDNTYSASQLQFTFYDLKGLPLPQGTIGVQAGPVFQKYFSASKAGGSFALLATFPVTGDTSQIGFVAAQLANSAGNIAAQQISIGN